MPETSSRFNGIRGYWLCSISIPIVDVIGFKRTKFVGRERVRRVPALPTALIRKSKSIRSGPVAAARLGRRGLISLDTFELGYLLIEPFVNAFGRFNVRRDGSHLRAIRCYWVTLPPRASLPVPVRH